MARTKNGGTPPKRCAVTRSEFNEHAQPVQARLSYGDRPNDHVDVMLVPRTFNSGSFGWSFCGKVDLPVNGAGVSCQGGINVVVAHSANAE